MPGEPEQPIGYVLCDDMIFTSRITGTAQALGLKVKPARTVDALRQLVAQQAPRCLIIDLANPGLMLSDFMRQLAELGKPRVVAYGSHVDTATLRSAKEAGCDVVLPRSKFVEDLPVSPQAAVRAMAKSKTSELPIETIRLLITYSSLLLGVRFPTNSLARITRPTCPTQLQSIRNAHEADRRSWLLKIGPEQPARVFA